MRKTILLMVLFHIFIGCSSLPNTRNSYQQFKARGSERHSLQYGNFSGLNIGRVSNYLNHYDNDYRGEPFVDLNTKKIKD